MNFLRMNRIEEFYKYKIKEYMNFLEGKNYFKKIKSYSFILIYNMKFIQQE